MKDTLQDLLSRNSVHDVVAPAPSEAELDLILQAAMRAPDHGQLRPWRFVLVHEDQREAFAEYALKIRQEGCNPMSCEKLERVRAYLKEVPLIIGVGYDLASMRKHGRIPEEEVQASTACAVMNILNAAHALGYGAFWSTGIATYEDEFQMGFGYDPLESVFMGFIMIGTPKNEAAKAPKARPDWRDHTYRFSLPQE